MFYPRVSVSCSDSCNTGGNVWMKSFILYSIVLIYVGNTYELKLFRFCDIFRCVEHDIDLDILFQ